MFGNLKDPESHVSKRKQLDRDYPVLETLLTKPRTTYLARIRNPNPKMPDYREYEQGPMTLQEFEQKMGSPFEEQGAGKATKADEIRGASPGKGAR